MCVRSMMVHATSLSLPVWHTLFVHIIHRSRKEEKKVTKKKGEKGRGNREHRTAIGGKALLANMLSRFLPDTDNNSCCQCHSSRNKRTGKRGQGGKRVLSFQLFYRIYKYIPKCIYTLASLRGCSREKKERKGAAYWRRTSASGGTISCTNGLRCRTSCRTALCQRCASCDAET